MTAIREKHAEAAKSLVFHLKLGFAITKTLDGEDYLITPEIFKDTIRQFYYFQVSSDKTSFNYKIFDLIRKADYKNLTKIFRGFPAECFVFGIWSSLENPDSFIREWCEEAQEDYEREEL